jgi:hypothetical protein
MRSGTTIVGQVLAASPDTVLIGEVRPILLDPDDHRHCDCGQPVETCVFWSAVRARLGHPFPTREQARAAYRVTGLAALVAATRTGSVPASARPVVEFLRAIAAVAAEDDRTVVDTSKSPSGILLWRLAGAEVDVVHALRDPRAVAEAQARPTAVTGLVQEPKAKTYAVWAVYNTLALLLRPFARRFSVAAYRRLRDQPRPLATRLWARSDLAAAPEDTGARFAYSDSHVLAGNPRRTKGSSVTIMPLSSASSADTPLPDFVIIGAQKAGSTSLMQHLGDHPQVFLPREETRYFRYPWYEFQTEAALRDAVRTDKPGVTSRGIKCPDLLCVDEYADRVVKALPEAKLIAVLREPVSRAVSGYFWLMQWGYLPIAPADEGLRRILDGEYDDEWPRAQEVLEFGRYGQHLQHWLKLVPREQLWLLLDEDLHREPASTLRHTFEFLGVRADVPIEPRRGTVNSGVYSLDRLRFAQRRLRFIMREYPGYEGRYLQPPANRAAWIADRALAVIDRGLLSRRYPNTRPQISAELRARLTEYYRADLAQLEQVLGRELPAHWHHPVDVRPE